MTKKRRNPDISAANMQRKNNADDFAAEILEILDEISEKYGYEFTSLRDRKVALNHERIPTRRGGKWTETAVRRVLKRAESDEQN